MKRQSWFAVAGLVAVVGLLTRYVTRRSLPTLSPSNPAHVVGAFHVHSNDSHDSEVSLEAIAAAAQHNQLDFVVLTDHNKQRPKPTLVDGLTTLSYAELSTPFGHVVQLGASFTLDASLRRREDVLHSIRAVGATPILAHPTDFKNPWTGSFAGAGGIEIVNLAAAARRAARPAYLGLGAALLAWPLNPELALAQLYDRDDAALAILDASPDPGFIGLCGTDAHGWIPMALNLRAWLVALDVPAPAGEARAMAVLKALRMGHFHCVAGLLQKDPTFEFAARRGGVRMAAAGDAVRASDVDELAISGPATNRGAVEIIVRRDGKELGRTQQSTWRLPNPGPGTYRVEVWTKVPRLLWGNHWEPVIYSNRLRLLPAAAKAAR